MIKIIFASGRRDRMSGATAYRNRKKNKNMDRTLLKRMNTVLTFLR